MRFMCIEFCKPSSELLDGESVFPVIVDWREANPKSVDGLLRSFVIELRKYFDEIGRPCGLDEATRLENCREHFTIATNHLQDLKRSALTKKLVIFIDDMDYAEDEYMEILKTYFLSYAASDKAIVVLSCRKPLLNSIRSDDQLRQCYHIQPQHIHLNDMDLASMLHHRLRALLQRDPPHSFLCAIAHFMRREDLDGILRRYAEQQGITNEDLGDFGGLPFSNTFYANLYDATHGNLRDIEELLPRFCRYQERGSTPRFHEDFIGAFMRNTVDDRNVLLDLVHDRSSGAKKKHKNNTCLQNVLEYFFFHDLKDARFFDEMGALGLDEVIADKCVKILSRTPYDLIDPEFIYDVSSDAVLHERYLINNKGRMYVNHFLRRPEYYELRGEERSARSYYEEHADLHSG